MARRAISEAQKQSRQELLLQTAWDLFQQHGYDTITINNIAERAGVAKGTVYLYFKTKEELFLSIQEQQLTEWLNELDTSLANLELPISIETIASLIADSLKSRTSMLRLYSILHTILESNITLERARALKQLLRIHSLRTGALLERTLSFLQPGQGSQIMLQMHVLLIGIQQLAYPALAIAPLLEEPEFAIFKVDFTETFTATLTTLLYGWGVQAPQNKE